MSLLIDVTMSPALALVSAGEKTELLINPSYGFDFR